MDSSSYVASYFYKFAALMFVFLALASVQSVIFPEQSILSGAPVDPAAGEVLLSIGLSVGLLFLAKFMFFRIRVIRYDGENIEIVNGSDTDRVTWGDVESVSKVIGVAPPLYRLVSGTISADDLKQVFAGQATCNLQRRKNLDLPSLET